MSPTVHHTGAHTTKGRGRKGGGEEVRAPGVDVHKGEGRHRRVGHVSPEGPGAHREDTVGCVPVSRGMTYSSLVTLRGVPFRVSPGVHRSIVSGVVPHSQLRRPLGRDMSTGGCVYDPVSGRRPEDETPLRGGRDCRVPGVPNQSVPLRDVGTVFT